MTDISTDRLEVPKNNPYGEVSGKDMMVFHEGIGGKMDIQVSGQEELSNDEVTLSLGYLTDQSVPEEVLGAFSRTSSDVVLRKPDSSDIRKITHFYMANNAGASLDFINLLPPGWTAYFSAKPMALNSTANYDSKSITLRTNIINSPYHVLTFLHEIGHANNPPAPDSPLSIQPEREAWAFALSKIRPFTSTETFNMRNVWDYVHSMSLKSHSDSLRRSFEISPEDSKVEV